MSINGKRFLLAAGVLGSVLAAAAPVMAHGGAGGGGSGGHGGGGGVIPLEPLMAAVAAVTLLAALGTIQAAARILPAARAAT